MASSITCSLSSTAIRATSSSSSNPDRRKPHWWAPLFGVSANPDYITTNISGTETEPGRVRPKITLGGFTEEKAKELRKKTLESSTFHDVMYHSAIASRLASDLSDRAEK
ncbi:hypothetical protein ACFE04_031524 [Oxalis oulophora]